MDAKLWQEQLIALYCMVSREYTSHLWTHVQRQSNNATPRFSDEEVLTAYLFGLLQQLRSLKAIHRTTEAYLSSWFPHLPSYSGFVHRLNALDALLPPLVQALLDGLPEPPTSATHLLDSMPIQLAQGVRAGQARVASDVADLGYCASKRKYYYGVKLHALALHAPHALPRLEQAWVSPASASDLTLAKYYTAGLPQGELFADKLYQDHTWQEDLRAQQQLVLRTPVRRVRNQEPLDATDRLYGTALSRVRQSIEVFFSWLQGQTGIENASRVRSTSGLWVHLFGRIAAALLMLFLNS
jgi:hypothetical protein